MRSKKAIMGLASIFILIFHLYIPVTAFGTITKAGYIGVDLFFLVSAITLSSFNKGVKISYGNFIKNRFLKVYLPFAIISLIAAIFFNFSVKRYLEIISGIEFFKKGGGAFLWFFPGIMILYLTVPYLLRLKNKYGIKVFFFMLASWGLAVSLLQYAFNYTKLFILLNRLPVFFIGLYWNDFSSENKNEKLYKLLNILLLFLGIFLIYTFGLTLKINIPVKDFYFVVAIPFTVSLAAIIELLYKHYSFPVLSFLGNLTLELYSLQIIFGYKLENCFLKNKINVIGAFILTSAILITGAYCTHFIFKLPARLIKFYKQEKNQ